MFHKRTPPITLSLGAGVLGVRTRDWLIRYGWYTVVYFKIVANLYNSYENYSINYFKYAIQIYHNAAAEPDASEMEAKHDLAQENAVSIQD